MLGIDGLDRSGLPLAAKLADTYCGSHPSRLARGILLPFAVALLEYDMSPRQLALDVAAGSVDLAFEEELLARPERLIAAERHASGLIDAALARFDANRTASREMREVLGSSPEPQLGAVMASSEVREAARETRLFIREGVDVVQVRVPASWEFAEARRQGHRDAEVDAVVHEPVVNVDERDVGLGHGLEEPVLLEEFVVFRVTDERQVCVQYESEITLFHDVFPRLIDFPSPGGGGNNVRDTGRLSGDPRIQNEPGGM